MSTDLLDQMTQSARNEYQRVRYAGPGLDSGRLPTPGNLWPRVLIPAGAMALVLFITQLPPSVEGPADEQSQSKIDPYAALALARNQLSSTGIQSPDRPAQAIFHIPAAPRRRADFSTDANPDLG